MMSTPIVFIAFRARESESKGENETAFYGVKRREKAKKKENFSNQFSMSWKLCGVKQ